MIDRSSAFAEFEFKLKITTMGMVTAEIPVKAFVYASGTSCTYTGTPATQNQAIAHPVTSAPEFDLTSLVTYGSNAQTDTACPIKQILWYYDTGSGVAFQEANPTSKKASPIQNGSPSGLTEFKGNIGITHVGNILFEQATASVIKFYVCGLEVLNLGSTASFDHSATESSTLKKIAKSTYEAWFTLDVSATNAVTECGVNKYELFQSDKSTAVANTVAYIDASSNELVIVQSSVRA